MSDLHHISVLLHPDGGSSPVLLLLAPKPGEIVLDVTLGLAGHAMAFSKAIAPTGHLYGLDADEENLVEARRRLLPWEKNVTLHHANFGSIASLGLPAADIIFADLGLSSPHVDNASRGFTFRENGPLDLRFDRSKGATAADLLLVTTEEGIANVLYRYGEIHESRRIARVLFQLIHSSGITTTHELRDGVTKAMTYRAKQFLPQVFQAIRIWINDEMGVLETLLSLAPAMLRPGGRFGVISFHSLEDRLVKQTFRSLCEPEKNPQTGAISKEAPFELLTKKAVMPDPEEIARNPRSRSAKFRVIRRRV